MSALTPRVEEALREAMMASTTGKKLPREPNRATNPKSVLVNDDELNQIRELAERGLTQYETAEVVGRSRPQIRHIGDRYGIKFGRAREKSNE